MGYSSTTRALLNATSGYRTKYVYNGGDGEQSRIIDPAEIETRREFDKMGRLTQQYDNFVTGTSNDDTSRATKYTYTADSQISTMAAVMDPTSNNQVTTYVYGTAAVSGSDLSANNLLTAIQYPTDSASVRLEFTYNRQGQVTNREDQNGNTHEFIYDLLGRFRQDRVTFATGTAIDQTVVRQTINYDNRGLPILFTSFSTPSGSSGVLNQVKRDYNDFGQLASEWQEHTGGVQTSGGSISPRIQYAYESGGTFGSPTNVIRPTSMTYPNSRQIDFGYAATTAITDLDDNLNRISQIKEHTGGAVIASYQHLGLGTKTVTDYETVDVRMQLWDATNGYTGLDDFGRLKQVYWLDNNTPADLVKLDYSYNKDSLPTQRIDQIALANAAKFDELYGRDGLQRLDDFTRGEITSGAIPTADATFRQQWGLGRVANWLTLDQDNTGDGNGGTTWDLVQTRANNKSNEITGITNTTGSAWAQPAYDAVGNTTTLPRTSSPDLSFTATYDAWNRLVKTDLGDGVYYQYTYDALGRRITKTKNDSGIEWVRHFYYTANWQCIEEREDDLSDPPTLATQYVWGLRYIDDLIQRKRDTTGNGELDETLYALNDRQFNVVALWDPDASAGNELAQRIALTPYGTPTFLTKTYAASTNTKDWAHCFQGLRTDAESGLIENRNRVLHPLLGRFLQRDPLGYPDGMNAYAAYHVMLGGLDALGLSLQESMDAIGLEQKFSKWKQTVNTNTFKFDNLKGVEKFAAKKMWTQASTEMTYTALANAAKVSFALGSKIAAAHPALKNLITAINLGIAAGDSPEEFIREFGKVALKEATKPIHDEISEIAREEGVHDVYENAKVFLKLLGAYAEQTDSLGARMTFIKSQRSGDMNGPYSDRDCLNDWYQIQVQYESNQRWKFRTIVYGEYCWDRDNQCYACTLKIEGYDPDIIVNCRKVACDCD